MNSTSPCSSLVSRPAKFAAFSKAGPLVTTILTPIALARMCASVVLPRPGGPLSMMWSSASPRCRAASTASSRRSLTLLCPWKSAKRFGRSDTSSVLSWMVSVTNRSGMLARCETQLQQARRKGPVGEVLLQGLGGVLLSVGHARAGGAADSECVDLDEQDGPASHAE